MSCLKEVSQRGFSKILLIIDMKSAQVDRSASPAPSALRSLLSRYLKIKMAAFGGSRFAPSNYCRLRRAFLKDGTKHNISLT